MIVRPLIAALCVAGCTSVGAQTSQQMVAENPQQACEIEASLLTGVPRNAVRTVSSAQGEGGTTYVLDLSGGTADCQVGADGRVTALELR